MPLFNDPPETVAVPLAPGAAWVERLLWLFIFSFAFDYRAPDPSSGAGIDQLLFLAVCTASSMGILALGWKTLMVRPGAWMIAFWGFFFAYMLANAVLQGVAIGRAVRILLPLVFCLFGLVNAHVAGCMGIRPSRIVRPILIIACINVLWRIFHGFAFGGADIEKVRFEVQSPANGWIAAWIACAILLRGRFHWGLLVACGVLFLGIMITVTRSLIFPVAAGSAAAAVCFVLGVKWGNHHWLGLGKRLLPVGAALLLVLTVLGAIAVIQPVVIERWNERLFYNAGDRNLGADISYLTRKAEADAIWKILSDDPVHFINGRGAGSTYYWDPAYLPEISLVIPLEDAGVDEIWSAGHSIWTYGLLSGGVIAVTSYLILLGGTASLSILAARANASDPGPDQWLAFLPFVATCCLVSESMTSNPFQERLVGIIFGLMAGLPQAFMVRSSWIHTGSRPVTDS